MLQIKVVAMGRGTRANVLASAQVELTSEDGQDTITVLDARVLRNKNGQLWVGYPNQTFPSANGVEYAPILSFSKELARRIADAVLIAFEHRGDFPEARQGNDPDPRSANPMRPTGTSLRLPRGEYGR
jgi:hypothetical protein